MPRFMDTTEASHKPGNRSSGCGLAFGSKVLIGELTVLSDVSGLTA
jgi:hypothetical protein